ncbi:MAG: DUF541 domain-containing protein [Candidatus Eisenbacteria bacterium]|nr:DUF541 domain-containing protein [Candidatus Eisenbacteria bacterium]
MRDRFTLPATILALSVIIAAVLLSATWRGNRRAAQTLGVTGSATIEMESDFGILGCRLTGEAPTPDQAYAELQAQVPKLKTYLADRGFTPQQLRPFPLTSRAVPELTEQGRNTGRILKYIYQQRFQVESNDVRLIEETALEITALIEEGVLVEPEMPQYHYRGLQELKVDAQAMAAQNAMERAQRVAAAAGSELGPIRRAKLGVLQITPRHSTRVSDYGIHDLSSIEKEITAVVHASFAIQ